MDIEKAIDRQYLDDPQVIASTLTQRLEKFWTTRKVLWERSLGAYWSGMDEEREIVLTLYWERGFRLKRYHH